MKKLIFALGILSISISAFAALPPFYQSAKEIRAIVEHRDVVSELGVGSQIVSITKSLNVYTLETLQCELDVEVRYVGPPFPGFVGPAQIELIVGDANCHF